LSGVKSYQGKVKVHPTLVRFVIPAKAGIRYFQL